MEAALRALKMKDLKKRSRLLGATANELDDAEDTDDAKGAVVTLTLAKAAALGTRAVKAKCRELGVDADDLDDCLDEPEPKEVMLLLLLKAAEGAAAAAPPAKPAAAEEAEPTSPAVSLNLSAAEGTPSPRPLSATGGSPGTPEMTVMKIAVEIKEQLGLDGSIKPGATAAAGREALGMAAAPAGMKLKDNLNAVCLELGIVTGWVTTPGPPSEGVPPRDSPSTRSSSGGESSSPTRPTSTTDLITMPDGSTLAMKEEIGRGGQATVYRGTLTEHGHSKTIAVKKLASGATPAEMVKFETELRTLTLAAQRCEHVCRVMGAVQHDGQLLVLMKEYVESMDDLLVREGALPVITALQYGLQIIRGLASLHEERILVMDLKPANVLIDEHDQLAISDFGLSTLSQSTLSSSRGVGGTPVFMSPEQFDSSQFGRPTVKADIWAFGCVLIALLQGHNPWKGLQDREIMMQVSVKNTAPAIPAGLPAFVADVLARCVEISPKRRPAAAEVVSLLTAAVASLSSGGSSRELKLLACPVGRSGKHIFLSYRRLDRELAMTVKLALESLGYVVFMDVGDSGLGAGDFQAQLEQVLKDTPVVVCLFTDSVNASGAKEFMRIQNVGDFVRLEIRAALGMQKLVVPLFTAQFDIGSLIHKPGLLPPDVVGIGKMNFVRADMLSALYIHAGD